MFGVYSQGVTLWTADAVEKLQGGETLLFSAAGTREQKGGREADAGQ